VPPAGPGTRRAAAAGPAGHPLGDALVWIAVASVGNLIGGVGLVTLFRVLQAWAKRPNRRRGHAPSALAAEAARGSGRCVRRAGDRGDPVTGQLPREQPRGRTLSGADRAPAPIK